MIRARSVVMVAATFVAACSAPIRTSPPHEHAAPATPGPTLAQWAQGAQLLDNLGTHSRAVTTTSAEAQAYFNQGLRLIYAFNHDEAARAFARAIELDPACAACYWGAGEALGPNYNMPAMAERWTVLWQAVQSAQRQAAHASPAEQALIAALAKRYPGPEPLSPDAMAPYNRAYADAMREVKARPLKGLSLRLRYAVVEQHRGDVDTLTDFRAICN